MLCVSVRQRKARPDLCNNYLNRSLDASSNGYLILNLLTQVEMEYFCTNRARLEVSAEKLLSNSRISRIWLPVDSNRVFTSAAGETTDLRHRHFAAPLRRFRPGPLLSPGWRNFKSNFSKLERVGGFKLRLSAPAASLLRHL